MKAAVIDAARTHLLAPVLTRFGDTWGVVGRDADAPKRWAGLLVARIERGVWWTAHTYARATRCEVVGTLRAEAD